MNLPGIKITRPLIRYQTHYVAPKVFRHVHEWQKTQRFRDHQLWTIHVCVKHEKPLVVPFDFIALTEAEMALEMAR